MSLAKASIIGIILGCSIYALFILVFQETRPFSMQYLRKVCHNIDQHYHTFCSVITESLYQHSYFHIGLQEAAVTGGSRIDLLHLRSIQPPPPTQAKAEPIKFESVDSTSSKPIPEKNHQPIPAAIDTVSSQLEPSHASLLERLQNVVSPLTHGHVDEQEEAVRSGDQETCRMYLEKYAVIPGVSWGTLSSELQK